MTFDFEVSTLNAIKKFNEFFREVKRKYPNLTMPMAREYLKNGTRIVGVPDELYEDLDTLFEIRKNALENEREHILAQAQKSNINLPENIISGKCLEPFFEDELYEKVPTLRLYEYMIFYSLEEIARKTKEITEKNEAENFIDVR